MSKPAFVDFKKLKSEVGIRRILEHYGLLPNLKEQGDRLTGKCSLCEGESHSFRVSLEKNCFKCFRCDAGGNILDFVAAKEDCSIREAALAIADWFEIRFSNKSPKKDAGKTDPSSRRKLAESPEKPEPKKQPSAGLASTLSDRSADTSGNRPLTFELKLDHEHPWFAENGIRPESIAEFGLGYCSKGMLAGRIAFPIRDLVGQLIGYAGRTLTEIDSEELDLWKLPPNLDASNIVYGPSSVSPEASLDAIRLVKDPLQVVLQWQVGNMGSYSLFSDRIHLVQLKYLASQLDQS